LRSQNPAAPEHEPEWVGKRAIKLKPFDERVAAQSHAQKCKSDAPAMLALA